MFPFCLFYKNKRISVDASTCHPFCRTIITSSNQNEQNLLGTNKIFDTGGNIRDVTFNIRDH